MIKHSDITTSANVIRDRILTAARKLFLTSGFRSVTMSDISQELGLSKKTLYVQFPSKETLLRSVLEQKFDEIEKDVNSILSENQLPFSETLKAMLACLHGHISEIQPAFVRDIQRSDSALFETINSRRQEIIRKYFGRLLERGRREGVVRDDIPVPILTDLLVSTMVTLITPARLVSLNLSPDKAFSQMLSIFLDGILVRKDS